MRALPVGQVGTGVAVGTGDEQINKAGGGNEEVTKGPSSEGNRGLWVQQRGRDLVLDGE